MGSAQPWSSGSVRLGFASCSRRDGNGDEERAFGEVDRAVSEVYSMVGQVETAVSET